MAWRSEFRDGPLADEDIERTFMAPVVPDDLYFVHIAHRTGWVLVGLSGTEPPQPWPGQVHYRLVENHVSELKAPGEDQGHAVYALADAADR